MATIVTDSYNTQSIIKAFKSLYNTISKPQRMLTLIKIKLQKKKKAVLCDNQFKIFTWGGQKECIGTSPLCNDFSARVNKAIVLQDFLSFGARGSWSSLRKNEEVDQTE